MTDAPLVSIVTPTYNHRSFIQHCLASAIAQTEDRWEQIVVDDGSTDGTGDLVRAVGDPRIRYVKREHRGIEHLADSYNAALSMARAPLVAVLEGDDFWPPDKLARQLTAFDEPDVVASWGRVGVTDETGAVRLLFPRRHVIERLRGAAPGETLMALLRVNWIPASTVVARRSALEAVGGFQQPPGLPTVDFPTWLALCRQGRLEPIDHVLGYHRRHAEQVTARLAPAMMRVLDCGPAFVASLEAEERDRLGIDMARVERIVRHNRADREFWQGRAALREGRRDEAAGRFRRAVRDGGRVTRGKALAGLASVALRLDLERVAAIRRRSGREAIPPPGSDA